MQAHAGISIAALSVLKDVFIRRLVGGGIAFEEEFRAVINELHQDGVIDILVNVSVGLEVDILFLLEHAKASDALITCFPPRLESSGRAFACFRRFQERAGYSAQKRPSSCCPDSDSISKGARARNWDY